MRPGAHRDQHAQRDGCHDERRDPEPPRSTRPVGKNFLVVPHETMRALSSDEFEGCRASIFR
jgi:hypothetical protein